MRTVSYTHLDVYKRQVKVRRIYNGRVIVGFAGSVADAFTLSERFEAKLEQYGGNLPRAAVELAQDWHGERAGRQLEAMLIAADAQDLLVLSGSGEVIDPDDGVVAIGLSLIHIFAPPLSGDFEEHRRSALSALRHWRYLAAGQAHYRHGGFAARHALWQGNGF